MGYISAQYKALSSWIYKHFGCDIQIYVLPVVQKRNAVFGFEICALGDKHMLSKFLLQNKLDEKTKKLLRNAELIHQNVEF